MFRIDQKRVSPELDALLTLMSMWFASDTEGLTLRMQWALVESS